MLTENRKYDFVGELTLHKSKNAGAPEKPMDDKTNWLFLETGGRQFSFVYKIENPFQARYEAPFTADLAFTMIEAVKEIVQLHHTYEVLRGPEPIGTVKIIGALEPF